MIKPLSKALNFTAAERQAAVANTSQYGIQVNTPWRILKSGDSSACPVVIYAYAPDPDDTEERRKRLTSAFLADPPPKASSSSELYSSLSLLVSLLTSISANNSKHTQLCSSTSATPSSSPLCPTQYSSSQAVSLPLTCISVNNS